MKYPLWTMFEYVMCVREYCVLMHQAQQRVETSLQFIVLNVESVFSDVGGRSKFRSIWKCVLSISLCKKLLQQIPWNRRMYLLKWSFIQFKINDTVADFTGMYVYIQWNRNNYKKLQRFLQGLILKETFTAGCSLLYWEPKKS